VQHCRGALSEGPPRTFGFAEHVVSMWG
jgi:hypothetical protein